MSINEKMSNIIGKTKGVLSKYSPEILTGIGVTSMVTSTILAVKATPRAMSLIKEKEDFVNKARLTRRELTKKEIIQTTWKEYLPAISFGLSGVVFVVCGCRINSKRGAALASAYAISERTLSTYRDKVIETIGEKKEKDLRNKINQDAVDKNPPQNNQVIITSKGNTLIRDSLSGRYFRSDLDTIRKVVNELNRQITHQNYISLNEFYSYIGLDGVKNGDKMGWNIDDGLIELDFSTCLADNDEPCICIDFDRPPKGSFDRIY